MADEFARAGIQVVGGNAIEFVLTSAPARITREIIFGGEAITIEEAQLAASDGMSYLGTLVYGPLIFNSGRYFEQDDVLQEDPIQYEGLKMHTVLTQVSMVKNVIVTPINGRNSTVKEYISDGDYNISIFGSLVGENVGDLFDDVENAEIQDIGNFAPEVDMARLKTILTVPDAITLTSDFLSIFNISTCVVVDFNIPQKEGTRDMQPFQINLLSDTPIDLNEVIG